MWLQDLRKEYDNYELKNNISRMNKLLKTFGLLLLLLGNSTAWAQVEDNMSAPIKGDDDTYRTDTAIIVYRDTLIDVAVNTNSWKHNWFFSGNVGVQKFIGDYNSYGSFGETLSPDIYLSGGHWVTPSFGAGIELGIGQSRGFTIPGHETPYTVMSSLNAGKPGREYYKQKINWWDAGLNIHMNLSRMLLGYEGANRNKMMGQFIVGLGVGWVHHYGYEKGNPQLNEISGKADLQYSHFLSKAKRVSLDVKARFTFYQTNFDGNFDYAGCQKWDYNLGVAVGLTWHTKKNSWTKPEAIAYQTVYKTRENHITVEEAPVVDVVQLNTFTFYVAYPDSKQTEIGELARKSAVNDHASLGALANGGYAPTEVDKLYSLADVYAALQSVNNNNIVVPGADKTSVNELVEILQNAALTKITVLSTAAKMDYYQNDANKQEQNARNVELANQRAQDVVQMLKTAPRMNTATPFVMLVNEVDVKKEHCVKVTVQYLGK